MEGNLRSGFRFAVGAMPSEPASAAARSERMSACRLVATTVSMVCGFKVMRMVMASTSILSQSHVGELAGHLGGDLVPHHHAVPLGVGLGHHGQQLARARAGKREGKAHDALDAGVVNIDTSGSPVHAAANAGVLPSEFSRTITQSSSGPVTLRSGLTMPGQRMRVGRTLAYWSKGWQMASAEP